MSRKGEREREREGERGREREREREEKRGKRKREAWSIVRVNGKLSGGVEGRRGDRPREAEKRRVNRMKPHKTFGAPYE